MSHGNAVVVIAWMLIHLRLIVMKFLFTTVLHRWHTKMNAPPPTPCRPASLSHLSTQAALRNAPTPLPQTETKPLTWTAVLGKETHLLPHNHMTAPSSVSLKKSNLRVLNVNCCKISNKVAEFQAALQYIKPDIVFGTESWLTGIKPGKSKTADSIANSKNFSKWLWSI